VKNNAYFGSTTNIITEKDGNGVLNINKINAANLFATNAKVSTSLKLGTINSTNEM
jgi:hypothetical protein